MLLSNEAALFSSLAVAAAAAAASNTSSSSATNTGATFWPSMSQSTNQEALNEFIMQHFAAASSNLHSPPTTTCSPLNGKNGDRNGGSTGAGGESLNSMLSHMLVGDMLRELLRQSGVDDLKASLDSFIQHVESNKSSQEELSNQFKSIQKALGSINANSLDKSTTLTLLQAFQNQLNNLSDRIQTSQKIALQTAKFFSALFDNCNATSSTNRLPLEPATPITTNKSNGNVSSDKSNEEDKMARAPTKKTRSSTLEEPIRVKNEIEPTAVSTRSTRNGAGQSSGSPASRRRKQVDYNEQSEEEEEHRRSQQQMLLQQLILHHQHQQQQQQQNENEENSVHSSVSSEIGSDGDRQNGGRLSNGSVSNELNKYPYDLSLIEVPDESTEEIARRIKDYITTLKISQRNFAESILNMKQANFSTLLSQPMTWSTLSKTYKDRFLAMYAWLNDIDRMDKLNKSKPRHNTLYSMDILPVKMEIKNAGKIDYGKTTDQSGEERRQRRITFTPEQLETMRSYFKDNPYPNHADLEELSASLGVETRRVNTWFMNQRQVNKRIESGLSLTRN